MLGAHTIQHPPVNDLTVFVVVDDDELLLLLSFKLSALLSAAPVTRT
jgi:hypothetical protein